MTLAIDPVRAEAVSIAAEDHHDELRYGLAARVELLVAAMQDEHRMLSVLAAEIEKSTDPLDVALTAGALVVLFDVCVAQGNRYLLPALAASGVDLAALLAGAPEIVGAAARLAG